MVRLFLVIMYFFKKEDMQKIVDANEKIVRGIFNVGVEEDKENR